MNEDKEVVSDEFMEPPDDLRPDTEQEQTTEEEQVTEGDTESDTPTGDTKEETPDEVTEVFQTLGLNRKYATAADALRAVPHLFDRIGQVENQLYNQPKKKEEPLDPQVILEGLNSDPEKTVKKLTEPQIEELKHENKQLYGEVLAMQRQMVVNDIPELKDVAGHFKRGEFPPLGKNKYWDAIVSQFQNNPMYRGQPDHVIILDAFDRVKDRVKATEKPKVAKVPDKTKANATTAGGPKRTAVEPNWNNLSSAQRMARAEKLGLVSDE